MKDRGRFRRLRFWVSVGPLVSMSFVLIDASSASAGSGTEGPAFVCAVGADFTESIGGDGTQNVDLIFSIQPWIVTYSFNGNNEIVPYATASGGQSGTDVLVSVGNMSQSEQYFDGYVIVTSLDVDGQCPTATN
jgi:hypothetical protein